MSLIHDPARVDAEIERLVQLLEEATEEYAALARREAETRHRRDVERAKAYFLAEGGPVAQREAEAQVATEEVELAELAYRLASALADAQREKLRSLREQLGALRTIAANLREVST